MRPAQLAALGRCPRARYGGDGPRYCGELGCPLNTRQWSEGARRALRDQLPDHCADDIAAVVRRLGVVLPLAAVGLHIGVSKQTAARIEARALAKLAAALRDADIESIESI